MGQRFNTERGVRRRCGAHCETRLRIGLSNGRREGFETFNDAWQYVTDMVLNDDLVWVNLESKSNDTIHIRKGL